METLKNFTHSDTIDSRDLINAITNLKEELSDLEDKESDEAQEIEKNIKDLEEFCAPFENYTDWEHGATLINEDYWVEYVEELVKDLGFIDRNCPSFIVIDWEQTAENVAEDYIHENGFYVRQS